MKILITGIAGFVGSTLARAILSNGSGAQIVGIDNLSYGYKERIEDIESSVRFVQADVADIDAVLHGERFDVIVHCAAIAPLPECQVDSHRAIVQNVANCGTIADFALKHGTRDIVFFSSGAIYEGTREFPTGESVRVEPRLVYPTSKFLAELYYEAMCRSHALNVTAIRLFNLYGPRQDYFRKQPPLIGYLLRSLIEGTPAVLFSTGEQRRDYIYIDDLLRLVVRAIDCMNARPTGGEFIAVNAGSGSSVSVNEIVQILEALAGRKIDISRQPSEQYWNKYGELLDRVIPLEKGIIREEVEKHTQADTSKSTQVFGWSARVSLEQGLKECLAYAEKLLRSR